MATWVQGFGTGFVVACGLCMVTALSHGNQPLAQVFGLAVFVGTVWTLSMVAFVGHGGEGKPPAPAHPPEALDDARERVRDLVTMESRLGRWCDEHGLRHGTDAHIAMQRAKTHVQHGVRCAQDATAHLETNGAPQQRRGA